MIIKTNEYNKVVIIPISNLGEAEIPQIGYVRDEDMIECEVPDAYTFFIHYYSFMSSEFVTNMNLGSNIYNLSAKM